MSEAESGSGSEEEQENRSCEGEEQEEEQESRSSQEEEQEYGSRNSPADEQELSQEARRGQEAILSIQVSSSKVKVKVNFEAGESYKITSIKFVIQIIERNNI